MADSRIWKKATAGTYADSHAPRAFAVVFVVLAFVLILVPSVGMIWARTDSTTENRELVEFPPLFDEDSSFNWDILSDLGEYFDDHFAYRNEAVTANARLRAALGTSSTDQVVVGGDGWLFYGGTLPDYLGQNRLSDRSLANIAHNLSLAQGYVESHDATFAFTLAPNKNSLDASHMPYYYLPYDGASNAERLAPFLAQAGVNYVDLFSLLKDEMTQEGQFGYLKKDSHWNNRWALIAAKSIMSAVGREPVPVDPNSSIVREDFEGDLQSMLYPSAAQLEENYYYEGYNDLDDGTGSSWSYVEGSDVTDSTIRTTAPEAQGSLLMFRDSFGNALLPFWASAYGSASFSKLVPYNLTQVAQLQADTVVVERAERHLDYLATNPPIMPNPTRSLEAGLPEGARQVQVDVDVSTNGSYWVVKGAVAEELSTSSGIYLVVEQQGAESVAYDPFWVSTTDDLGEIESDRGFMAYAATTAIDLSNASISVYVA